MGDGHAGLDQTSGAEQGEGDARRGTNRTASDHTRRARARLGPEALLVTELKVVLDDNPERARELGRARVGPYLRLSNYVANLRRIGFDSDDLTCPGSDRLVDALAVHGDPDAVAVGLRAHLAAGANSLRPQPAPGHGARTAWSSPRDRGAVGQPRGGNQAWLRPFGGCDPTSAETG